MKKSEKIGVSIVLTLVLILTSCGSQVPGGDKPIDTATALNIVKTGTLGIQMRLLPNYPPPLIYDKTELVAMIDIDNKGNFPLVPEDCFIQITGYDPNIIKGGPNTLSCATNNNGPLEGKTVYNLNGGTNQITFTFPDVSLPPGVFDYSPTLNFVACYHYHTTANPVVCVDPRFYQVTPQEKTCLPKAVSSGGGGQGAPVGISYVNVEMAAGKAIFEINVINYGTPGRVIARDTDLLNCGTSLSTQRTDLDKVYYSVSMVGKPIDCKPYGFIRLVNGQGKIVCSAPVDGTTAYETPLLIDLDYNYIQSFKQLVKIVRTPGT